MAGRASGRQGVHDREDAGTVYGGRAVKRYLLDTGAASDTVSRRLGVHDRVKEARAAGHRIGIGLPVLGELYAGVEYSATRDRNLEMLRRNLRLFIFWPFTPEAAQVYGRLYAELRRKGRTIG